MVGVAAYALVTARAVPTGGAPADIAVVRAQPLAPRVQVARCSSRKGPHWGDEGGHRTYMDVDGTFGVEGQLGGS